MTSIIAAFSRLHYRLARTRELSLRKTLEIRALRIIKSFLTCLKHVQ